MKKNIKRLNFLLVIGILLIIILNLFPCAASAVAQKTSSDISSINTSKYPGIKEKIETLKKIYPNWNFKVLYTGLDWNQVIASEYTGHGSAPKNLIEESNSYKGEWICSICGNKVYDSGNWKCASSKAIAYMMDPRASINPSDVFQFLELSYNNETGYSKSVVQQLVRGTFLDNSTYVDTIMNSCKQYNVNPYYIVARAIDEQGRGGSTLVKGNGYNGQYIGYYNVFNIGAYGANKDKVILNGLAKAKSYGWTSINSSLSEGIQIISKSYIGRGQNTLYLQKFDVDNSDGSLYSHQYMQNVMAAQTEGEILRKWFTNIGILNSTLTFIIPVYENMPSSTVVRPSTTSTNSSDYTSGNIEYVRVNANPSIRMRNEPAGSKVVGYLYYNDVVTRLEKATTKINGTYWDKVVNSNGQAGYVARCTYDGESQYKDYLISLSRVEPETTATPDNTTVKPAEITTNTGTKGDANGDGKITSSDYVLIKNHIMGTKLLDEASKKMADYNGDGKITSSDYVLIKNYIMNR